MLYEPEAAAVHCAQPDRLAQVTANQNFMICDAGGGTVVRQSCPPIWDLCNEPSTSLCAVIWQSTKLSVKWQISRLPRCVPVQVLTAVLYFWTFVP